MGPEIEFRGGFAVPAKPALSANNWYLGFACTSCERIFAVLDEPTETGALKAGGTATFETACPNCGTPGTYPAGSLQIFQAPSSRSTVIPDKHVSGEAER